MHEMASVKRNNQFYPFMGPSWCRRKLWIFQFPGSCVKMTLNKGSCGFSITGAKTKRRNYSSFKVLYLVTEPSIQQMS